MREARLEEKCQQEERRTQNQAWRETEGAGEGARREEGVGAQQQEGRSNRADETGKGRDAGRDRGTYRVEVPHNPRIRERPWQQRRRED
jgi:hypothetical protein